MTIASAFNDIAVAQGGAASKTGSIAGAIDALNDALAGSDQQGAETIEDAVRLLGDHIGGGSTPSGTIEITENGEGIDVAQYAYADVDVSGGATFGDLIQFDVTITKGIVEVGEDVDLSQMYTYALLGIYDRDKPLLQLDAPSSADQSLYAEGVCIGVITSDVTQPVTGIYDVTMENDKFATVTPIQAYAEEATFEIGGNDYPGFIVEVVGVDAGHYVFVTSYSK